MYICGRELDISQNYPPFGTTMLSADIKGIEAVVYRKMVVSTQSVLHLSNFVLNHLRTTHTNKETLLMEVLK